MFFPIKIAAGADITFVGTVLFLIMLGTTLSMVVIGRIADTYGKKDPCGDHGYVLPLSLRRPCRRRMDRHPVLRAGNIGSYATMPITAAIAQEMVPNSRGMASSIVIGLSRVEIFIGSFSAKSHLYGINATLSGIVALLPLLMFLAHETVPGSEGLISVSCKQGAREIRAPQFFIIHLFACSAISAFAKSRSGCFGSSETVTSSKSDSIPPNKGPGLLAAKVSRHLLRHVLLLSSGSV